MVDPKLVAIAIRLLSKRLKSDVGVYLERMAQRATDDEAFLAAAGRMLLSAAEREAFITDVRQRIGKAPRSGPALSRDSPAVHRLSALLADQLGPISSVIFERELQAAHDLDDLVQRLAAHVEGDAARSDFTDKARAAIRGA